MTSRKNEVATIQQHSSVVMRVAARFGVDPDKMLYTLKSTAFRASDVSNEQMMALLVVADQYKLNPWTREIYAFPDKQNGIVPVVGVDGWSRIINEHPQFDGMDFVEAGHEAGEIPEWIECTIHRKDRAHPTTVREYFAETKRDTGPWKSHPRRMLRHKAMIQCARLAFGFAGIYDPDEAERISAAGSIEGEARVVRQAPRAIESAPQTITERQLSLLCDKLAEKDLHESWLVGQLGIDSLDALPFERMDEALEIIASA